MDAAQWGFLGCRAGGRAWSISGGANRESCLIMKMTITVMMTMVVVMVVMMMVMVVITVMVVVVVVMW